MAKIKFVTPKSIWFINKQGLTNLKKNWNKFHLKKVKNLNYVMNDYNTLHTNVICDFKLLSLYYDCIIKRYWWYDINLMYSIYALNFLTQTELRFQHIINYVGFSNLLYLVVI